MQLWVRRVIALASLVVLTGVLAGEAVAQGVASAAITGVVTQEGGRPVDGAAVIVTNTLTGQRFQVATRPTGRYTFENLPPGGPYTVEVRAIGFQAGRRNGVSLALGQRLAADFALRTQVVEVQELVVQGAQDPIINRGRTGAASTISDSAVSNLPTLNRSFTDLITASPAVAAGPGGRPSIAGSNNRFNNIQIDGAVNNDLFGLGSTGAPGGQTSGRAIPIDAVQEFQVLVAPFDVRQGGFVGGLVNAVTRSGENQYRGSMFLFGQSDALVTTTPLPESGEFSTTQFGGSFSGPIIPNKAHFFVSYDQQVSATPYAGEIAGVTFDTLVGTDGFTGSQRCAAVTAHLATLGYDGGTCGAFDFKSPNRNFFAKLTAQAGTTGQVEFTLNYATSSDRTISRVRNGTYQLTGGGYTIENTNFSPRFRWSNVFGGRFNNEFLIGYTRARDPRKPDQAFTPVQIQTGAGYNLVTGAEFNSHQTETDQDIWELTDNLTFDVGAHRILLGTHNEVFEFLNDFYSTFKGQWTFSSEANFEAGIASGYTRNVPAALAGIPGGRADGPTALWGVRQFGAYAQDQFSPLANLTLTFGVRADLPVLPSTPPTNPRLLTSLGSRFDTGKFPSGNMMISPRLGFNYDVGGRGDMIVRGGAGIFSGRPAYVWLSNAYSNSGLEQASFTCSGAAVPNFNTYGLDPDNQPTQCVGSSGPSQSAPNINMFNDNFKFPQAVRLSLGVDKRLPFGFVASVDGMFSNSFKALYISDQNLTGVGASGTWPDTGIGVITGEGNRIRYGQVDTTVNPIPRRLTSNFRQVLYHENRGRDYSYSAIFQLNRRFANKFEMNAGYTYSRSYDLMSATNSTASSNFGFATLDGPISDRNLRTSAFDRPHTVKLSGLVHLPYNFSVAMQYVGLSGSPYAYTVAGDVNGDGVGSSSSLSSAQNDLFYVPVDINDITFSSAVEANPTLKQATYDSLNAFITREPCLSEHRGEVMQRNSCRNPWQTFLNATVSWSTETYRGQRLELSAAFFNVLHFINEDWGLVRSTTGFEGVNLVSRVNGYDKINDRNRYALALPEYQQVQRTASRGKILLGARYTF